MKVYQINYDLRKQHNYDELFKKIMSFGECLHPFECCWLVVCTLSANEIRDDLKPLLEEDDQLLITRLQNGSAWSNLKDSSDWLKAKLDKAV